MRAKGEYDVTKEKKMPTNRLELGILFSLGAAFFLACMRTTVSAAGRIPAMELLLCRSICGIVFLLPMAIRIKRNKGTLMGKAENRRALLLRSLLGFLSVTTLFLALGSGKQADVTILSKTSPFFITLFSAIFLHQKIDKIQIPALFLAFLGAYFVVAPKMETDQFPLVMACLSAIAEGGAITYIDYLQRNESSFSVIWFYYVFSLIGSFLFSLHGFVIPTFAEGGIIFLMGIFAFLGQISLNVSLRLAQASQVGIHHYFGIIFSVILGCVFLNEGLEMRTLLGGGLVILAGVLVYFFRENKIVK